MSAGGMGALPPEAVTMRQALLNAGMWALVTLGLAFPIILFGTEQDFSNRIVLYARPMLFVGSGLVVFAGRLLWLLTKHPRRPKALAGFVVAPQRLAYDAGLWILPCLRQGNDPFVLLCCRASANSRWRVFST